MTGFMSQAPPSGQDYALAIPVQGPKTPLGHNNGMRRVVHQWYGKRFDHQSQFEYQDRKENVAKNEVQSLVGVFPV